MLPSWGGILTWIPPVTYFDQMTIYEYSGIDGLVMVRMLYFATRLFLLLTFLCNAVLLPVYLTGSNIDMLENDPNNPIDTYGLIDRVCVFVIGPFGCVCLFLLVFGIVFGHWVCVMLFLVMCWLIFCVGLHGILWGEYTRRHI